MARGGPDGGDGGRGGSVILRGSHDESSLIRIFFEPQRRAEDGEAGHGKCMHGRNGRDRIVPVPCGTEVYDESTGLLLGDIVEHGQDLVVARGGSGGLGNVHWKSSTHRSPTEYTEGGPGEIVTLRLHLKLMADAGLIGYPNAGKSSLLTQLSDAHPKVAAYPFTTLNPIIGTMIFDDYTRMTVADIPGIVKGAHEGVGLGHGFLRHIERASCLVYVIDMAGVDGRSPVEDFQSLETELRMHREDLVTRARLIVANKMDIPEAEDHYRAFRKATGLDPLRVSAKTGQGMETLKAAIGALRASGLRGR